jgi:hypothetical protein
MGQCVRPAAALDARVKLAPFEESSMLDVVMVALALGFFAVTVGYAYACDRL